MIKLKDLLNEGKPPTRKEMAEWINAFNNASLKGVSNGYMKFDASNFAIKGMKRILDKHGITLKHFSGNSYGIKISDKNKFSWNESIVESDHKGYVFADVVDDIIKDENFKNVERTHEDSISNSIHIYVEDRDKKTADTIIKTLKTKYGVNGKWHKRESRVEVPSGALVEVINERQYADTYFDTFREAAEFARSLAEKEGYEVDEDDWFKQVATGGRYTRSRPSKGKTHRFSVGLLKNGKPARKVLHFQVYGMKDKYELNAYIN